MQQKRPNNGKHFNELRRGEGIGRSKSYGESMAFPIVGHHCRSMMMHRLELKQSQHEHRYFEMIIAELMRVVHRPVGEERLVGGER